MANPLQNSSQVEFVGISYAGRGIYMMKPATWDEFLQTVSQRFELPRATTASLRVLYSRDMSGTSFRWELDACAWPGVESKSSIYLEVDANIRCDYDDDDGGEDDCDDGGEDDCDYAGEGEFSSINSRTLSTESFEGNASQESITIIVGRSHIDSTLFLYPPMLITTSNSGVWCTVFRS